MKTIATKIAIGTLAVALMGAFVTPTVTPAEAGGKKTKTTTTTSTGSGDSTKGVSGMDLGSER
jgi:hypothetical protein